MKNRMKRPLFALFLGLAASILSGAELVERIVARVNDRLITQSEYDKRLAVAMRAPRAPDAETLRGSVLEDMIRERLLDERAKEMAVAATDEEVEAAVARVKAQYNLTSDAEFDAALADSGMTRDDLRRQMRETITLQKVIGRDVASRIDLSDDGLRIEYERRKEGLYDVAESAKVSEIVLKFTPGDAESQAAAAAKAEEIRAKIKAGASFADLAKAESEGKTKDRGGELGTVAKGELVEALDVGDLLEQGRIPRAGDHERVDLAASRDRCARPRAIGPSARSRTICASASRTSSTRSVSPSTWTSCAARRSSRSTIPSSRSWIRRRTRRRSS